jgi:hypothetical protein
MVLRLDENDTDSKLNPGQADSDQKFNRIARDETNREFDSMVDDPASGLGDVEKAAAKGGLDQSQSLGDQEDSNTGFSSSFTGKNSRGPIKASWSWKKQGPIGGLIALVFGGAVGFGGLFGGPSLLLVNMSEVVQGKFNTALSSLDNRSTRIMAAKVKGTVSGVCAGKVNIACKYQSLSSDEMKGMEKQAISFKDSGGNVISSDNISSGKFKPSKISFNGEDISPEQFTNKFARDPAFRTAMQDGFKFNARYATVGGKVWNKVKTALHISKEDPFANEKANSSDSDRLKTVQEETKNGAGTGEEYTPKTIPEDGTGQDPSCANSKACTPQEAQRINSANKTMGDLTTAADKPVSGVEKTAAAGKLAGELKSGVAGAATRLAHVVNVTGYYDDLCSVYRTINGIGYAAKAVRYSQLARYAMIYLTTADMIKAGTAKPEDVSYLASTLTQPLIQKDSSGNDISFGSATDTLAYKNAAFGDSGSLDDIASNYLVAAGLTGTLIGVSDMVKQMLGGDVKVCGTLQNPWVQAGSLVGGIALMLIPGVGEAKMSFSAVAQGTLQIALVAAEMVLPSLLQNIVAGQLIDSNTVGAAAGDAFVSGSGALMSTNAQYSGNAPLTPDQAVAYENTQKQTLAQYAAQDRLAYSPLDPTNSNTFAGTLVTQLTRYAGNLSSFGSAISGVGSFITHSFGSVFKPLAYAADSAAQYQTCQDDDYRLLNLATDLFCNPVRGIPPEYLNNAPEPADLYQQMLDSGQINADGFPVSGTKYETIYNNCINRDVDNVSNKEALGPLGNTEAKDGGGKECFINDQTTANYYIYFIDQNALDQMENGMVQSQTTQPTGSGGSSVSASILYKSSVNTPCATGTTDAGTAQGYYNGQEIDIRLCSVPGTADSSNSGQPIQVNSVMSANFLNLTQAMGQALGSPVKAASSFRTMAGQQAAYNSYGSSRAAKPGYSNHQMGLAVDFQLATGNNGATKAPGTDRVYDWLTANANKYGVSQLSIEAWHWQAAGAN